MAKFLRTRYRAGMDAPPKAGALEWVIVGAAALALIVPGFLGVLWLCGVL